MLGLTELEGETLLEGESDGLADELGLTDADGLIELDGLTLGETEELGDMLGESVTCSTNKCAIHDDSLSTVPPNLKKRVVVAKVTLTPTLFAGHCAEVQRFPAASANLLLSLATGLRRILLVVLSSS